MRLIAGLLRVSAALLKAVGLITEPTGTLLYLLSGFLINLAVAVAAGYCSFLGFAAYSLYLRTTVFTISIVFGRQ